MSSSHQKPSKNNFWKDRPIASLPATKTKRKPARLNFTWLIFGVIFIAVVVLAIVINNSVTDHSANKILRTIQTDNSDLNINWDRYQTIDIALTETLNISKSGTYHLTGSLKDGSITVEAGVGEVRLILDNVSIKNSTGPAIACYNAENLVIELVGENTLEDGSTYDESYDEDVTSTIYSKADLAFGGTGSLKLIANHQDGIKGKDDVKFNSGTYIIDSVDDAILGKDSVYIMNGDFTINSTANAIKSTNEADYGKGFILIEKGNFDIISSAKGLKSTNSILIYDGDFTIDSYDDAIHSNNYTGIIGGNFIISSGDDGIHADRELIIDGGTIDINKSYEGLEAQIVTINGGNLDILASDDGINAGGGADGSALNRQGANPFNADEKCILSINGGKIYINASGDGIDSNGYLYFNGGKTIVDGPTNNGNGALDSGVSTTIQGGEVIAVGASGMAGTLGSNSGICNISVFFTTSQNAGTKITIKDSAGHTILQHTATKTFSHLAAGSDSLTLGGTYTIYLDGTEYTKFTISEVTTTIGDSNNNFNNPPRPETYTY